MKLVNRLDKDPSCSDGEVDLAVISVVSEDGFIQGLAGEDLLSVNDRHEAEFEVGHHVSLESINASL